MRIAILGLGRMGAEHFSELLSMLFEELKFEVEKNDFHTTECTVDLFAVNRTPITGGRIYVRGICLPADQEVDVETVFVALQCSPVQIRDPPHLLPQNAGGVVHRRGSGQPFPSVEVAAQQRQDRLRQ